MQKYISRYSNNKLVSAAQYITELICEHKAKKDKEDLHYKFWEHKKWAAFYRNQIASANKLLKTYDAKAIIDALNSSSAQKIYSLRAPHLLPMIEQAQYKILNAPKPTKPITNIDRKASVSFNRKNQINKNIVSKLKDLEE
jgi:hypothetical protein